MMRASVLFVALGVLAGCGREPDRALRVTVTLKAVGERRVQADCLRLSVLDDANELKSTVIARPTDDVAVFGVLRGSDLPAAVRLQVSGYLGTCGDEASFKLNAQADPVAQTFPEEGVKPVELTLEPPGPALDADRDGFVAVDKGGVDCRDVGTGAASVFPGAGQLCDVYEDTDCDGAAGCDDSQCAAAPACAAQADRLVISSMPVISEMRRYECVGPFTVTLQNAQGPRSAVRDVMVGLSSSLPGTSLHAQAGCGDAPLTSYPMRFGDTSFQVYLEADGQAFGLTSVRATAPGVAMPGAVSVQVRPQPIAQLRFGTALAPLTAGTCSTEQVTLELIDAMGRPTAVENPASLTLSANPTVTGGLFFSDASCTTAAATAPLAPGQGVVRLHVSSQRAGDITMSAASSTGQGPVTQVLTVVPAAATRLAFANQSLAVQSTQSCSAGQLEVELRDAFDNTVTPTAPVAVRMTSTLSDISFHPGTDAACQASTAGPDFTIPAGSTSVRMRVKPGLAATGTVTASAPTLVGIAEAVQNLDVAGGPPARVVLLGQAQSPLAGDCSPAPIELAVRDAAGNPSSFTTNVTANLSVNPAATGTFGFFTAPGCSGMGAMTVQIPSGQSRVQLYFRGTRAVPAFAIGAGITTPGGITAATPLSGNAIRPNVPGKVVFVSTTSQTVSADNCSGNFNINVLDTFDNPTSFTTAQDVTVSPAAVTLGSGVSCFGTSVSLPANTTSAAFTANSRVTGTYMVTATVGGLSTATPAQLTVTPGASTLAVSVPTGGAATLQAGDCQPVTLLRRDAWGNNAPTSGTIALGLPAGTFAYTGACPPGSGTGGGVSSLTLTNSHTASFNLKPTVVGTPSVTATLGAQVATVNLTVTPGAPVLQFEAPTGGATTITAGACATVTVARKDLFNNDVPLGAAGAVTFGSLPTGMTLHAQGDCGGAAITSVPVAANGARATFLVRSTVSGAGQTLQLSLGGDNLTLTLGVNPASPIFRFVTPMSGSATAVADGCVAVQVERRDTFNNPVPLGAISPLTFAVTGTASVYAATNCSGSPTTSISMAAGAFQQSFGVKSTVAGSHTVRATLATQFVDLALTVTPGTPVLQFEAPTGGAATIVAGTCAAVTVARKDAFGNDVPLGADGSVTFGTLPTGMTVQATGDCNGTPITSVPVTASAARASFLVRSTLSGAGQTLQVTLGTQSVTLTLTVNPAAPLFRFVTPMSGAATAAADGCVSVQVERRDAFNNPAPLGSASSLTFAVTGTASVYAASDCTGTPTASISLAAGTFQRSFGVKSTVAGTHTIRATLATQFVDLVLTVTPSTFAKLVVLGLPTTLTAGTCTASPVTVRRTDAFDNPITADGPLTVTLSSTPLTFSSQSSCAGAAAGATVSIPMGSSVSTDTIYATGITAGGATVTATAGTVTGNGSTTIVAAAASKIVFLNPPSMLTVQAGACSAAMTVQLRDQYDNPVTPSANVDVTLTASPSAGVTFSRGNTTCTANDTTVQLTSASPTRQFLMKATAAPATVQVTLSSGTLATASLTWSVTVGPPTVLAWKTSPPATVDRFTCTAVGVLETRDSVGNVSPATSAVTVTPSSSAAAAGLVFYSDATCTTLAPTSTIAQGATEVALFAAAGGSGATNLNATAPSFTAAGTRSVTVANNPATLVVTPASLTLEAGACAAVTIERQVGGSPTTLGSSTLQLSVPGGTLAVSLHTDAACSSANALTVSAVAAPGESSKTFYVRGRTGGDNAAIALNATAAETSGAASNVTVPLSALPLVRRGTCTVADAATSCRATLAPAIPGHDISRSFLVFSSTGSPTQAGEIRPMDANLECHLEAGGSLVEVVCTRPGNRQAMDVNWQVVSHGRSYANGGVSVQHLAPADTVDGADTDVTISTVDPATSFLLLSSSGGTASDSTNDGSHFMTATLTSGTNVRLTKAEAGVRRYSVQVVSVAGASVTRGEVAVTGFTASQTGLASVFRSRTTLLYSSRGASGTAPEHMCKRRLRGSMATASTQVEFARGAGTAPTQCDDDPAAVAWERVQWPACGAGVVNLCASVQHLATLAVTGSNTSGTTAAFTAVDRPRALVLSGGQGPGGQSAGESDFTGNSNTGDDTGAFHGRAAFASSTTATVTRSATGATSNFSLQVVEFSP
jgi:hypothetical protein